MKYLNKFENYEDVNGHPNYIGSDEFIGDYGHEHFRKGNIVWKTKNGNDINIKDMSILHIENTLKLILNDGVKQIDKYHWLKVFSDELYSRQNNS